MLENATPGGGVAVRAARDAAERHHLPRHSWSRTLLTLLALNACGTATELEPIPVAVPESIDVSPGILTVAAGDSATLAAVVRDALGESIHTATVEWSSSDETVAVTTQAGMVHGMSAGSAQIRARAGSVEGIAMVTVETVTVGNEAPTAVITSPVGDLTVTVGDTVHFLGSAGDADGTVASHTWSFGDGSFSSLEEPEGHVYGSAGSYQVTYQVTDDSGTPSSVASRSITVEALPGGNQAPTAQITSPAGNPTVTVGDTVHFQGSSSDSDGSVASHAWSFGDGTSSSLEEPEGHVYGSAGSYQVTYQVTDDLGASSPVVSRTITVEAPAPGRVTVFEDGFESGDLTSWDGHAAGKYSVTSDPNRVRSGTHALQARVGEYGELNKWFMPGYSDVHVQFDVMFEEGFQNLRSDGYGMHFFGVLGNRIDDAWSAHGQAGVRPDGTDFFVTVLDPIQFYGDPTLHPFFFYTNYPDMSCGGSCYGNPFTQSQPAIDIVPGQWHRIEIRLRANTPGEHDGAQELWIDGVRKINAQGMRWRDTDEVRVNEIAVWNYMPGAPPEQYIWIDNVVVTRPHDP